ncbi:MAG: hypothetical protein ABJO29_01230 [Yoonia sp.]|uniref:hypothetical protein n=1 Tax=Yoonia sp. TaxID=2212373 RepID=UPI0032657D72
MTYKFALPILAFAGLAACEIPDENTLSRADYRAFEADDSFARSLSITPAADIPAGSATYQGHIRSDATLEGQSGYQILGLLEMDVDISSTSSIDGAGEVNGSITEVNLLDNRDDGYEDQSFAGELTVNGRVSQGQIDARADGLLTGVLSDIGSDTADWDLTLEGNLRDSTGEVAAGSVFGGTDGTNDDYDLQLLGGGRFYAERD